MNATRPDVPARLHETALLDVRGLTVRYAGTTVPAVDSLSLQLPAAGSVGIVGESGSGKSTALLALTRLLDATSVSADHIRYDGRDVLAMPTTEVLALRRGPWGMVFQDPAASWNPTRSIGRQLLAPFPREQRERTRDRLVELMERVGLRDARARLDDLPHRFSGGMLQRAMIAGTLIGQPRLLFADEPTSALDTSVQRDLLDLLTQLRQEESLALLMVSHDLGVVARMCDHVLVMRHGSVVESAPTRQVLDAPEHPYTRGLLAATPRLHGPRKSRLSASAAVGLS